MFDAQLHCTPFLLPPGRISADYIGAIASYWSRGAAIERTETGAVHWREGISVEFAEDGWRTERGLSAMGARNAIVSCGAALPGKEMPGKEVLVFVSSFPAVAAAFKARMRNGFGGLAPARQSTDNAFTIDLTTLFLRWLADAGTLGTAVSLHAVDLVLDDVTITVGPRATGNQPGRNSLHDLANELRLHDEIRERGFVQSMTFDVAGGRVSVAGDFAMTVGDVASDIDDIARRLTLTFGILRDCLSIRSETTAA